MEQDGEFITAQPRDRILGAHAGFQAVRNGEQQQVPGVVAEAVVYLLELVQIHEEQGDLVAAPADGLQRLYQPVFKRDGGWPGL